VVRSGDEKGACRKGYRESELSVVPRKQGNAPRADPVEGREGRLTELLEGHRAGAQKPGTVSTKQQRIAKLAGEHPDRAFTSLAHHIDLDWLREAYCRTRKEGAVGVDGQTAEAYGADLTANLQGLLERAKSGLYQACRYGGSTFPKAMVGGPGLSAFRRLRTKSCNERSRWCWSRCTSKTFWNARTATARTGQRTRRWRRFTVNSARWMEDGSLNWTSRRSLTHWITPYYGRCSGNG